MSLEREGIPPKQIQLLYPSPDISLSLRVNWLINNLQKNNTLHTYNDSIIISKREEQSQRRVQGREIPITLDTYDIFDGRNGLLNFAVQGIVTQSKFIIDKGILFEHSVHQNPDPMKKPYIDSVATIIRGSTELGKWYGTVEIHRHEYDDLALIRETASMPFKDLPSEKDLDEEMEKLAQQATILQRSEGRTVFLNLGSRKKLN